MVISIQVIDIYIHVGCDDALIAQLLSELLDRQDDSVPFWLIQICELVVLMIGMVVVVMKIIWLVHIRLLKVMAALW